MTTNQPSFILFTYPESVVGRRVEWYLTLRGIPYSVCRVHSAMPRLVLERLGVHYRRIPVLAAGRDIYCDSRGIIATLEDLYSDTPRLGASQPYAKGIERVLESWTQEVLFMKTAGLITADAALITVPGWLDDRAELTGRHFDEQGLKDIKPDAVANARLHLQIVEDNLLADGRQWLSGGDMPALSDVHVLWVFDWMNRPKELMGMKHGYPEWLNERTYPRTFAWIDRMEEAFQSSYKAKTISEDEAVEEIERSNLFQPDQLSTDPSDPNGLQKGDLVDLIALDSAPATGLARRDVGHLEGLTVTSATITAKTQNGANVRIHYPRANVRVRQAKDGHRLRAGQIPEKSGS